MYFYTIYQFPDEVSLSFIEAVAPPDEDELDEEDSEEEEDEDEEDKASGTGQENGKMVKTVIIIVIT